MIRGNSITSEIRPKLLKIEFYHSEGEYVDTDAVLTAAITGQNLTSYFEWFNPFHHTKKCLPNSPSFDGHLLTVLSVAGS